MARTELFNKVTIIGVGFMGGSLGLAIKKHKLAKEVVGFSHRQSTLMQAVKSKAVDQAQSDLQKAVKGADLIILATPVETILKILGQIKGYVKRNCIVTDIGSAKEEIVDAAEKLLPHPDFFVGSHPMVGSEKRGVANAISDLYEGAACLMTPTEKTNQVAKEKVKAFWTRLGMTVKVIAPADHDEILSYVSHLPHLLAYGMVGTVPEKYLDFSSKGFKDTTRIAGSSPQMWSDICLANSKNVLKALDEIVQELALYRKAIVNRDSTALVQYFTKAKEKRDSIVK